MATAASSSPQMQVHGGQLVERVALQAGVADPMGQLHGAFGQVGVRRVALVLQGGDGEHGRLDLGITAGQHPGLRQQRPLLARRQQLGHDARCVRDHLGRGRELDGGAAGVTGPACRLGRGAVEPDRLVARMTAPRHGRAEVQGLGSLGRVGGQRSRLLVPLLGFTELSPGVGELRQPHGELVCLDMPRLSAGRPAQRGSQLVGHLVEPLGGSASGQQPGRGLQAPVQMSGSYVVLLAVPVHQLGAVLPDRLEHPIAGAGRSVVHHHEVVLGQAREGVRDRGGRERCEARDLRRRCGGERAGEHRRSPDDRLLVGREQAEAPVEHGAQRAVPLVHPRPTRQQVQRVGQPPVQPVEAEGRHAGGGAARSRAPSRPAGGTGS